MGSKFSDELISAYIDGELSAEEQAEVERVLEENTEHRQMFEELRALSVSLQSMPKYEFEGDVSARVQRRAERMMLSEDPAPADLQPIVKVDKVAVAPRQRFSRLTQISVVAGALAATILVILAVRFGGPTQGELADAKPVQPVKTPLNSNGDKTSQHEQGQPAMAQAQQAQTAVNRLSKSAAGAASDEGSALAGGKSSGANNSGGSGGKSATAETKSVTAKNFAKNGKDQTQLGQATVSGVVKSLRQGQPMFLHLDGKKVDPKKLVAILNRNQITAMTEQADALRPLRKEKGRDAKRVATAQKNENRSAISKLDKATPAKNKRAEVGKVFVVVASKEEIQAVLKELEKQKFAFQIAPMSPRLATPKQAMRGGFGGFSGGGGGGSGGGGFGGGGGEPSSARALSNSRDGKPTRSAPRPGGFGSRTRNSSSQSKRGNTGKPNPVTSRGGRGGRRRAQAGGAGQAKAGQQKDSRKRGARRGKPLSAADAADEKKTDRSKAQQKTPSEFQRVKAKAKAKADADRGGGRKSRKSGQPKKENTPSKQRATSKVPPRQPAKKSIAVPKGGGGQQFRAGAAGSAREADRQNGLPGAPFMLSALPDASRRSYYREAQLPVGGGIVLKSPGGYTLMLIVKPKASTVKKVQKSGKSTPKRNKPTKPKPTKPKPTKPKPTKPKPTKK